MTGVNVIAYEDARSKGEIADSICNASAMTGFGEGLQESVIAHEDAQSLNPLERVKLAFTLAEVLITLGIIGVVAALTLPTLMANYKKKVVVTRMQKFYTTINQAIKLAEVEHGDVEGWDEVIRLDADSLYNMWTKYIDKYYVNKETVKVEDGVYVKSSDGSGFLVYYPNSSPKAGVLSTHYIFCVSTKACDEFLRSNGNKIYEKAPDGKDTFLFIYSENALRTYSAFNESQQSTREFLMNGTGSSFPYYGCANSYKAYCAALIEYDGWKISDDYPVKF